jgi:hypothetical protein
VGVPLDLEAELERLYAGDLAEFVPARTRLARALRDEGRRAEASRVAELRRPVLAVWVANQLARRDRREVDLLLDAGHRLLAAQTALLGGGGASAFDEARGLEQAALKRLRSSAAAFLGERASPEMIERVMATLRAAAVSAPHREELARGRLTVEVAPSGFEALTGAAPTAPPARPRRVAPSTSQASSSPPPRTSAAAERAEARLAKRREIARARKELQAASERLAAVEMELRAAGRAVAEARKRLAAEEGGLGQLRSRQETLGRAVQEARQALHRAESA